MDHHRGPIVSDPAANSPSPARLAPSFRIRGAGGSPAGGLRAGAAGALRLDRINSRELLRSARRIYFRFLADGAVAADPVGVVMVEESSQGRVVFEVPVLLPEEQFVPIDLLRARPGGRSRSARGPGPWPQG
ncbi:MAG: hypothetical protein VKI81_02215 [Synechococcaceae cyanobacterium]|nr:hypothetical protein [Synechococcaceae cyanobacterium]